MTESDRIGRLENEVSTLKDNLLNYICQNPLKDANPQWTEERLKVLESQTNQIIKADIAWHHTALKNFEHQLETLEMQIKEVMHTAQKYYEDDRRQLEDEISHATFNEKLIRSFEHRLVVLEQKQNPETYNANR